MAGTSSQRMTVDQMLERYGKGQVEQVLFILDFEQTLVDYQDRFDPDEDPSLSPDVLWRIMALKYQFKGGRNNLGLYGQDEIHESVKVNIDAVLAAYRNGGLEVSKDMISVWWAGNLVKGPMKRKDWNRDSLPSDMPEWREKYGPGLPWVEDYNLRVKLKGWNVGDPEINITNVLDDTGSNYLELFLDDAAALMLDFNTYPYFGAPVMALTANGITWYHTFQVRISVLRGDFSLFGVFGDYWFDAWAVLPLATYSGQYRCSGPALRLKYYTATNPMGRMMISNNKSGLRGLP
ncbi:hypothetical protein N7462_000112 [Penicillium macrosclerotiorum]|uniref:uncharacterized protein n=1 Tax=Penicillium macrosclerotiorum TaxID=303699 RepID=UPI002546F747|nr:uncharacterized protein N7462_000112 [Penicillium macrosclerotiorum]KAJ5698107.1 hypothetical protein N7462_000112 [Penicillium macrosclerotiorum]